MARRLCLWITDELAEWLAAEAKRNRRTLDQEGEAALQAWRAEKQEEQEFWRDFEKRNSKLS